MKNSKDYIPSKYHTWKKFEDGNVTQRCSKSYTPDEWYFEHHPVNEELYAAMVKDKGLVDTPAQALPQNWEWMVVGPSPTKQVRLQGMTGYIVGAVGPTGSTGPMGYTGSTESDKIEVDLYEELKYVYRRD